VALTFGFSFRMLAIRYHWSMPKFDYQCPSDNIH
ncbi:MAG: putative membrane protein YeiH, partial [Alteromonadaceae bacterium]